MNLIQSEPITVTVNNQLLTVDFLGSDSYDIVYQETTPYFLGDLEGSFQAIEQLIEHLEDNPTQTQFDKFYIPIADPSNPLSNPLFSSYDYVNSGFVIDSEYTSQFIMMVELKNPNFEPGLLPWQTWVQFNGNEISSLVNDSSVFEQQNITITTEINEDTTTVDLPQILESTLSSHQSEQGLLLPLQDQFNHFSFNDQDQLTIEVDGQLLEVNFPGGEPYQTIFSETDPYFLGDFTGALEAQQQLIESVEANPENTTFTKFYTPIADPEHPITWLPDSDYVISVVLLQEDFIATAIILLDQNNEDFSGSLPLPWQTWVEYTPIEPINYIDGTFGSDFLEGSSGADQINGKQGNDTLAGLQGDDELIGAWGSDVLIGGLGDDVLEGGIGTDWLDGGPGSDLISSGEGADWIVLRQQGGLDTILNFVSGSDRFVLVNGLTFENLSITESQQGISINLTDSGEELAILTGDIPESLTANDFVAL